MAADDSGSIVSDATERVKPDELSTIERSLALLSTHYSQLSKREQQFWGCAYHLRAALHEVQRARLAAP